MLKKLIKYLIILLFMMIIFSIQSNVFAAMIPVNTAQGLAEYLNTVEVDSATYSGNVVTLQKSITLQEELWIDSGTIELHFNGNTINGYGLLISGGNIKLYDDKNGGIILEEGTPIYLTSGNITIDGGFYESSDNNALKFYGASNEDNSVTINRGSFITSQKTSAVVVSNTYLSINNGYFRRSWFWIIFSRREYRNY